ncbi:MAG: LamG domain-containing protein [bacterium]|nr:LamG domain-containing protein [bacterium]
MSSVTISNRKLFAVSIAAVSLLLMSIAITQVKAATNDSSINLKKDPGSGLFTLTVRDPDGIQEFSLTPAGKSSYGGGLSGCKPSFSSNNVSFADPTDFTPVMSAYVIDCNNNTTELEIHAPVDGLARSVVLKKEEPPTPPPTEEEVEFVEIQVEEIEEGPLFSEDIQYPVPELDNCGNEAECRSYCDNANNAEECFAFAKKYNLISEEEAEEVADKFLNVKNGPGGCNSGASCEEYCSSVDRLDECISFAEETGYYSPEELAEAKKFQELVKSGAQFPGGCEDRNTCEIYCSDASNMEECLNFAEKSGFMPQDEIDEARKFMTLMQNGESPGGCNSKEQCENFCSEEGNIEECIAFAEKAGVMTSEEAEMVRKIGGKGPGGCQSKGQCEAYCEANSEECFNFAKEHGLISEADLEQMRQGMAQFRDSLDKMPPEAVGCMKDAVGEENFNRMVSGEPVFDRSMEGKMKSCFGQVTAQFVQQISSLPPEAAECIKDAIGEERLQKLQSGEGGQDIDFKSLEGCFQQLQQSFGGGSNFGDGGAGGGGNFDQGGFSGPGGCKNTQECTAYCQEHPDECRGFGPPPGGGDGGFPSGPGGGGFSGPGGCTNAEECTAYCQANYADPACSAFGGGGGPGGGATQGQFPGSGATSGGFPGGPGGGGFPGGPGGGDGGNGDTGGDGDSQSCVQPPSGLVSWWSADLVSGTVVPDINKSYGNNGTISGGVTTVPMEVGDAFQFDGSSGYINMGNPSSLNFGTGPFSLETWFNWDGGGSNVNNIIRKSNYGPGRGSGYWLRIGAGTLEFSVGATTGPDGQSIITAPITRGVWHHVVATRDSSDDIHLYIDGKSQGTVIRKASGAESTSGSSFALGAWVDQNSEFFSGDIDEVSVYNRALSAGEAYNLFDSGSIGKCAEGFGRTNRELDRTPPQQQTQQQAACPEYVSVTQCPTGEERFLSHDSPGCQLYSCRPKQRQTQQDDVPYLPQAYDEIPLTPQLCANFTSVPQCSYVGAPDSQNYNLCTRCKASNTSPTSSRKENNFFANIFSALKLKSIPR